MCLDCLQSILVTFKPSTSLIMCLLSSVSNQSIWSVQHLQKPVSKTSRFWMAQKASGTQGRGGVLTKNPFRVGGMDLFSNFTIILEFNTYLRSWKPVRCVYRVIEAQVEVWENKKCCGKCLHSFFEFSRTFTSIEIGRTCFLFHLENTVPKRENSKQLLPFDYQNVNSLSSCHHYINSSWDCSSASIKLKKHNF